MTLLFLVLAATQEPLHVRVDRLIAEAAAGRPVAGPADDAEFLRRATLDFAGEIPAASDVRAFLADAAPDKRTRLVDALLASPRFAEHWADRFDLMLMERRDGGAEWRRWLAEAFRGDAPWDAMTRQVLATNFRDEKERGAGAFITKRLEKYGQNPTDFPGLTRDIGRLFLGVDLQCAQCHRHLKIKDYRQADFQGLLIVTQNLMLQSANDAIKVPWVTENLLTQELEFSSVFKSEMEHTPPRVPFGEPIAIPTYAKGEEWAEPPDKAKRSPGIPKFSPLKEIADRLATGRNAGFSRNIANRVWFLLMGRGLVEPLDLAHSENPPSHPALLDLLAGELAAHGFSLRWLVRELALTETYRRSGVLPEVPCPEASFRAALQKPIAAEAFLRSVLVATGERERVMADPKLREEFTLAFKAALANAPGEPEVAVNPTLQAALFLRNSRSFGGLLERRPGNLIDRLAGLEAPGAVAEEVYASVLGRMPAAEEREEVAGWLRTGGREAAVRHLAWALLSSAEFFSNH